MANFCAVFVTEQHGVSVWNRINKTLEAANKAAEPAHKELPSIVVKPLHQKPPPQPSRVPTPASVTAEQPAPRPIIKLKVGGAQVKSTEKAIEKPVEKPSEKSADVYKASQFQVRRPKIPDEAPPPYVDDGSHDLLQEVIAIEREKDEEKRQRKIVGSNRESPPAKASGSGPPGKRRKPNVESNEDDVLRFATPISRKDKLSVPSGGTGTPVPERPPIPTTKTVPVPPPKHKKKGSEPAPTPAPAPEVPRISKGKERDVTSAQPTPSKPRVAYSTTALNEKKCRDVLRVISKLTEYPIFAQPVDPIRDGCPT